MGNSCCCCVQARELVSKKKRRTIAAFTDESSGTVPPDGVNLDLVSVHPRIIAMGFPSEGFEAWYRNPYEQVKEYLDLNFGQHYKVYNLCSEAQHRYDPTSKFDGRVAEFPFPDHHACPLEMIPAFVADAGQFLSTSPDAVCAIHCKAGKGRTGLMSICLMMVLSSDLAKAQDAITAYGVARTHDGRGLTHRSQIRYAHYWQRLREEYGGAYPEGGGPTRVLRSMTWVGILGLVGGTHISVSCGGHEHVFCQGASGCSWEDVGNDVVRITLVAEPTAAAPVGVTLKDDVRIEVRKSSDGKPVAALTLHTLFSASRYSGSELDKVYKNKQLRSDAGVELHVE